MRKSKKGFFRLFACLILGIQVFSTPTITGFADETQDNVMFNDMVEQTENEPTEEMISAQPIENNIIADDFIATEEETMPVYELKPILEGNKYTAKEIIPISFDKANVESYSYVAEGVTVIEKAPNSMQFDIIPTAEFGSVDVYADYGAGEPIKSSVYTYLNEGEIYVSEISKDQAWYDCMEEKYNDGLITMEQWEDTYSELSRSFGYEVVCTEEGIGAQLEEEMQLLPLNMQSSTVTLNGYLYWEVDKTNRLQLRNTYIELRDEELIGSTCVATGYTNDNGWYTFTVENPDQFADLEDGGYDLFLRIYSKNRTFEVAQDWVFTSNYIDTDEYLVLDNVETGATYSYNYCIKYDEGSNKNKSFYVQQGMGVGERFALAMGMTTENFIHVTYPALGIFPEKAGFCWGDIASNCYSLIGRDVFNNFDLVIHEYGHFVQNAMNIYGATLLDMVLYNPNHPNPNDDLFEEKDSEEYAMNLVWSESWATIFSQIAQEYYSVEYNHVPNFADQKHGSRSMETVALNINSGEAQESAVTAFLWDIYDSYNSTEIYDNTALGYGAWWAYTTRAGIYTLTDFMECVDTYLPHARGDIGAIMAHYRIAPSLTITNEAAVSATVAPQLKWVNHGSVNNPNDHFKVVFYSTDWEVVYMTDEIPAATTNHLGYTTYDIPTGFWIEWVRTYGGVCSIRIGVLGYHTEPIDEETSLISGPYFSNIPLITVTPPNIVRTFNKDTKYAEQIIRLDSGYAFNYRVIFTIEGTVLIQTFGMEDTLIYIYDEDEVLCTSNDDGGYQLNSFIKFNPTQSVTYKIQVRFYGGASGQTKLTITCANGAKKTESTSLSTYDDILTITTNVRTYTWNTYAQKNRARVIRFVQQTSGFYSFSIESDFDTYLYVIDPTSDEEKVIHVDYDDDSGEGNNASLIRYLKAGVPYYVVYSAYNPSVLTETKNLSLVVTRILP